MNSDPLAPWYQVLETAAFGGALQARRTALLPWALSGAVGPRRVLLLGEGDGRFGAALLAAAAPGLEVDVVESSGGMIARARRHYPQGGRNVRFHQAEARVWLRDYREAMRTRNAPAFDLVTTLFFLDCFSMDELPGLLDDIAAVLSPGARWLVADFRQPAGGGFRARRAQLWLATMYAFFRWTTGLSTRRLADYRPCLFARGFRRERAAAASGGLLIAEGWRALSPQEPPQGRQQDGIGKHAAHLRGAVPRDRTVQQA